MSYCIVLAIYLGMAQSHMDVPANHIKIAEGGKFLEQKCEEEKKKSEKKLGESKLDKAKKE
jgi:hypothetical protein